MRIRQGDFLCIFYHYHFKNLIRDLFDLFFAHFPFYFLSWLLQQTEIMKVFTFLNWCFPILHSNFFRSSSSFSFVVWKCFFFLHVLVLVNVWTCSMMWTFLLNLIHLRKALSYHQKNYDAVWWGMRILKNVHFEETFYLSSLFYGLYIILLFFCFMCVMILYLIVKTAHIMQ